jgi:hypothetical protein
MNINPPHFSFPFTKPESNEAVSEYHASDCHSISPRKIGSFKEMPVSKRIRINIVIADMKGLHPSQAVTENCHSVLVIRWEYTNKAEECLKANTDFHVGCSRGFRHVGFLHFKVAGIVPTHPEGDHGLGGVAG